MSAAVPDSGQQAEAGPRAGTGLLLTYAFSTDPSPLAVTLGDVPAVGVVDVSVSTGGAELYCSQVMVAVPVGDGAGDLFSSAPEASVNTARWSIVDSRVVAGRQIGLPQAVYAVFTFGARDPTDYLLDYSLVLGVSGAVNAAPGAVGYAVEETAGTSPTSMQTGSATFPLAKDPPTFFLRNLVAVAPDAPTVPCSAFANGDPVLVSWESNGTWFSLYAGDDPTPLYAGPATSFLVADGLTQSTAFVVAASMTGDPDDDAPSPDYLEIVRYAVLTVEVTDPDATPRSVAVAGDASVGGDLAVAGDARVAGSAQVTGDAGVTGNLLAGATRTGALDVDGPVTIGTSLTVHQWAELSGGAVIDGAFSATGNALMADLTVGGTFDAAGSAVLPVVQLGQVSSFGASHVAMLAAAVQVPVGPKFVAPTDGFVLGTVLGGQGSGRVWAVLSAQTATGTLAQCSGGTVTWTEGLQTSFSPMSNTLLLPVASGDLFWVTVDVSYGNPTCLFWWLGIGSGGLGSDAAETRQHE